MWTRSRNQDAVPRALCTWAEITCTWTEPSLTLLGLWLTPFSCPVSFIFLKQTVEFGRTSHSIAKPVDQRGDPSVVKKVRVKTQI